MYIIRGLQEQDVDCIANFEIQISVISFGDKAIIDHEFHKKKILTSKDKSGMLVISTDDSNEILGWLWMEKKKNSLTGEIYINFKSFYIAESIRGNAIVDTLLEKGVEFSKVCGASYIVGKVHANNIPMRSLYKNHSFLPTHITMELNLDKNE